MLDSASLGNSNGLPNLNQKMRISSCNKGNNIYQAADVWFKIS